MPKNNVSDPITDLEVAFARLVLSGAMTDRQAAQAVGLNPDSAAYTKAKPRVRAYMLQHRAAAQQQLVQQDAGLSERAVEEQRRLSLNRQRVLDRLWEIANLSPEITRGSVTGQVKCLSIIVAMENFIPSRHALPAGKDSAPAPTPQIYKSAWLRKQEATADDARNDLQPDPPPAQEEDQQEDSRDVPESEPVSGAVAKAPSDPGPSQPAFADRVPLADGVPPYVSPSNPVPDTRVPFSIKRNPFARRPR